MEETRDNESRNVPSIRGLRSVMALMITKCHYQFEVCVCARYPIP